MYGVPRYCIATPTAPPKRAGGATETPSGVIAEAPTTSVPDCWASCAASFCADSSAWSRCCASAASRAWRACSSASSLEISPLIDSTRRWRSASPDSISCLAAARWETICSCRAWAFFRNAARTVTSCLNLLISPTTCVSCEATLLTRLDLLEELAVRDPSRIASVESSWGCLYIARIRSPRRRCATTRLFFASRGAACSAHGRPRSASDHRRAVVRLHGLLQLRVEATGSRRARAGPRPASPRSAAAHCRQGLRRRPVVASPRAMRHTRVAAVCGCAKRHPTPLSTGVPGGAGTSREPHPTSGCGHGQPPRGLIREQNAPKTARFRPLRPGECGTVERLCGDETIV
jgi:hypothetical protein